jgi:hypothetical protein
VSRSATIHVSYEVLSKLQGLKAELVTKLKRKVAYNDVIEAPIERYEKTLQAN